MKNGKVQQVVGQIKFKELLEEILEEYKESLQGLADHNYLNSATSCCVKVQPLAGQFAIPSIADLGLIAPESAY